MIGFNVRDIPKTQFFLFKEEELGFWDIPNVKANHAEKTLHPCSFPIELVERCVLAYSNEGDVVLDPFSGVGSTMIGALMNNRKAIGCELYEEYMQVAKERVLSLLLLACILRITHNR